MVSFENIYSLNGSIVKDNYSDKPDNIYYFIMYNYLLFAIGTFSEYSYTDILDYTPFEQEIYTFSTTVLDVDYVLSPAPPTDCLFYVSVDGVELDESEYSFDSNTNTLTIPSGGEVYVGCYTIGSFNVDPTLQEQIILADAMSEWFVEGKVNDSSQLEQVMYAGVNFHSQAPHNTANLKIEQFRRSKSYYNMLMYTYSKNMPKTINLGKRADSSYEQ